MNYLIYFTGFRNETYSTIIKLIIESAKESDYVVTTYTHPVLSPFSTWSVEMLLKGSAKTEVQKIVIDFDGVYVGEEHPVMITPKTLKMNRVNDNSHYWGYAGVLVKMIPDISPAYITSYLLKEGLNKESGIFRTTENDELVAQSKTLINSRQGAQ